MDPRVTLINSLWAGLFAGGLGVLLTAPPRYIVPAFLCGFAGRLARDVFMSWGLSQNWSTVVAAAVIVLVAAAITRRHLVSPVVLASGIMPLGASAAMFYAIIELMKVSALEGEALSRASVALNANIGKVFTTSLAIALGLAGGMVVVRLLQRKKAWEGV